MTQPKAMRQVFGEMLCELGKEFPKLVVLDADVSTSTQTKLFANQYPERFFNFGVAEANMVSAAAGMSTCGLLPVASTFAVLLSLRALDPIRSLVAYNRLNVKLAGAYAGLSDFADGASHQAVLDLSIMRSLPNMTVLVPSDIETTRGAVRAMLQHPGPVYLRLSRDLVDSCHGGDESFTIGQAKVLREGTALTLAVCGTLLPYALAAADELAKQGLSAAVVEFPTLKPFDTETLLTYAQKTGGVVSIEEHSILGGLGSAIAESLAEGGPARLRRVGIQDRFGQSGDYRGLLEHYGLTTPAIVQAALELVQTVEAVEPEPESVF